ncbi:helix-turn-helix transcriptional regulator [Actinomycetes bacterium KLBMP 9797]
MPKRRSEFPQSLRSRWLGERMRELRDERGLTLKYVAAYLGCEFSTLARYERAEWPFRKDHVVSLLDMYGVYDEVERERLVQLAQDAWRVSRWEVDFDNTIEDPDFVDCLWLELRSEEICCYSTMVVPPLLWTESYASALFRALNGPLIQEFKVDRWVALLRDRQKVLSGKDRVRVTALIEEQVLHRPVGSPAVMRDQLEHLLKVSDRGDTSVQVRVVPTNRTIHPGCLGAFTVFRMPLPYPPVAYLEHLGGRLYVESDGARQHNEAFDKIAECALTVPESAQVISDMAAEEPLDGRVDGMRWAA